MLAGVEARRIQHRAAPARLFAPRAAQALRSAARAVADVALEILVVDAQAGERRAREQIERPRLRRQAALAARNVREIRADPRAPAPLGGDDHLVEHQVRYRPDERRAVEPALAVAALHVIVVLPMGSSVAVGDAGGDIAKNLMSLYIYFNQELLNVSINHNRAKISFIQDMLVQLRDAWAEAASESGNAPQSMVTAGIDING